MKLKEVCEGITDGSHNPPRGGDVSDFLMLSSKNIYDDRITLEDPRYLTREQFAAEDKRTKIEPDDVLMTIVGTVGRSAVVRDNIGKICLQRSVAVLHPRRNLCNSRYLMYVLRSKRSFFEKESHGVAQKGLYLKQLSDIDVDIPEMIDQEAIVNILDKVNGIIEKRQCELNMLDNLIKARFVEMFGDMVMNPNDWGKYKLGDVCDVRDGTHDSPHYYSEGYPLVTSKNVTAGQIDITDCGLICEEDYRKINQRSKVDRGDILMPMIGTVGNPVIVNIEPDFAIKNVALIKFREESKVLNSFVKSVLESEYFDNAVISKVRGGTQKFISLGDIRNLEICLPPLDRQKQFEEFIKQVDKSRFVEEIITIEIVA